MLVDDKQLLGPFLSLVASASLLPPRCCSRRIPPPAPLMPWRQVVERKRELESTKEKMDKLLEKLYVGRERGIELSGAIASNQRMMSFMPGGMMGGGACLAGAGDGDGAWLPLVCLALCCLGTKIRGAWVREGVPGVMVCLPRGGLFCWCPGRGGGAGRQT